MEEKKKQQKKVFMMASVYFWIEFIQTFGRLYEFFKFPTFLNATFVGNAKSNQREQTILDCPALFYPACSSVAQTSYSNSLNFLLKGANDNIFSNNSCWNMWSCYNMAKNTERQRQICCISTSE